MFMFLIGCSNQCKECWDVALIFYFKYYFACFGQIMGLSETGRMIYLHKSKQQIILLWLYFYPFNPAYFSLTLAQSLSKFGFSGRV